MSSSREGPVLIHRQWSAKEPTPLRPEERTAEPRESLLLALLDVQSEFIRGGDAWRLFEKLLAVVLEQTGSEYGFLGEVTHVPAATPRFQALVSTPPVWMEDLRELAPEPVAPEEASLGLRGLIETALETGQPVLANVPTAASHGARGPANHQPLRSFLALPLLAGDEQVGLLGIADRPGGYDARLLDFLQPLLSVGGNLLLGWRNEQRRRRLEEEWRHNHAAGAERLRRALASVEDGLWDWNIATRELRLSRHWLTALGYAEGELEPTVNTWRNLCHPEDLPRVERVAREHLTGATPRIEFEYRARRKDGSWAWLLSKAKVVDRDAKGRPLRVMGTDADITSAKRSEERLDALLRTIPDLIFRMRIDGTYLDFIDGSAERTKLPPEAFLGRNIRDLPLPRPFVDQTLSHLEHTIREGTLGVFEYELEVSEGLQHYEARLVRSGPDEAVCIVRNVTERKRAEQHQAQLVRAEKMASLGQLAAGIAHEINNPVGYVTSNLCTLRQYAETFTPLLRMQGELLGAPSQETRVLTTEQLSRLRELWAREDMEYLLEDIPELIEESLVGTRRIKEIVQTLGAFSRGDDATPQSVDLNAELESTLRMVWNELKYKCEVKRDFAPLPSITCYPNQLAQVFTNLLINAAHAIETRGQIVVSTRHEGSEVQVRISDTGKGMTPETLSRIFTPFFTTKPRGQGTGLGLSISYDIITRHKGRIDVHSEPGKGTTFTVSLPVSPQ